MMVSPWASSPLKYNQLSDATNVSEVSVEEGVFITYGITTVTYHHRQNYHLDNHKQM